MKDIDLNKLKESIALRKGMPDFGPDTSIERLRIINATMDSFTPEVVEALIDQLESAQRERDEAVLLRLEVSGALSSETILREKAEAELKRRDEAKPVYFVEIEGDQDINAGRIQGKERPDLGLLPDGINYLYAAAPAAVLPPALNELAAYDNPEICLWKHDVPAFVRGANWMREQAIALDCQPPAATLPTDIVITAEVARVGGLILKGCESEYQDDAARKVFNGMLAAATAAGGGDA